MRLILTPLDYNKPLYESETFKKYVGGSPANIAVGMARLGKKIGFLAKVSDDQFGTFVERYFENEGIDISHISRCQNGEKLGLTFTEILSPTESSILMYRGSIADLQLSVEDIDGEYIKSAKALFDIRQRRWQLPLLPGEAALKAVSLAKEKTRYRLFLTLITGPTPGRIMMKLQIYYSAVASQADIILGSRRSMI